MNTMKNKGYVYHNRVSPADAGMRVLDFYARYYPRFSRDVWRERIRAGRIRRGQNFLNENSLLSAGDVLSYHRPPWVEPDVPGDFGVLLEDDHLLIVDKPSGLPVLPGDVYLENTLLVQVRKRFGRNLSPVHRLDRPTSGCVIFAKTPECRRDLGLAIHNGGIQKTYLAVAGGNAMPGSFVITEPIGMIAHSRSGKVAAVTGDGRPSVTRFRVVERRERCSLLMVFLKTGRSHQIRIHLAFAGFPLVGESFYGIGGIPAPGAVQPGEGDFLLHAWRLRFSHPVSGCQLRVTAPFPDPRWG